MRRLRPFWRRGGEAPDPDIFERVKVTDYKMGARQLSEDALRATQPVTFRYYRAAVPVEQSKTVEMVWQYDTKEGDWFLVSFPAF